MTTKKKTTMTNTHKESVKETKEEPITETTLECSLCGVKLTGPCTMHNEVWYCKKCWDNLPAVV